MGFESIYKLSVIMQMVDSMSAPLKRMSQNTGDYFSKLDGAAAVASTITKTGVAMLGAGKQMTEAVLAPVKATFETKRAIGELASLGVEKLQLLEDAAEDFSGTWAGTSKADFITAAYDIKSGIASLSDEGVAEYTKISGVTAQATKSTIATMTDLFATGYGIYKGFYNNLSDTEFASVFSAGIAESVKGFKTNGSEMAAAIKTLGASATSAQVPLEEQLAIMGMLQATMSGSEAGTKYKAFLRSAVKGGEELGLSFVDVNNNLLALPVILDQLKGKFGDTIDAAEKLEIQRAFGDAESVAMLDLLYNKSGELEGNILNLYSAMSKGQTAAEEMAETINSTDPAQYDILQQKLQNAAETLGNTLTPKIQEYMGIAGDLIMKANDWISNHDKLAGALMNLVLILGIVLTVGGSFLTVAGSISLICIRTAGGIKLLVNGFRLFGIFAGPALAAAKSFVIGMLAMAKQAIVTAVTAMPGLIASVWSFTAALLANPVTWVVIGIIALIAAIILLWQNWDQVVSFLQSVWEGFVNGIKAGVEWVKSKIASLPEPVQNIIKTFMFFALLPLLIIQNWDTISAFFKAIIEKWKLDFENGINGIKEFFTGLPQFFKESGAKLISTFAEGILSAISKPAEAVKGGLQTIRNMLPFSDAKTGPLDSLTYSGTKVMGTVAEGIKIAEELPAQAVEEGFEQIDLSGSNANLYQSKKNTMVQPFNESKVQTAGYEGQDREKQVVIQKLDVSVDFENVKDIPKLMKLLKELEEYVQKQGTDKPKGTPALA